MGIHRRDPAKHDFDYGAEYRAKVTHCKSYTRSVASSHGRPAPFSVLYATENGMGTRLQDWCIWPLCVWLVLLT